MRMRTRALGIGASLTLALTAGYRVMPAQAAPTPTTGYSVGVFAMGDMAACPSGGDAGIHCYYNADSLTADAGHHVYVGYQNNGDATGAAGSSIVAKYSSSGGVPVAFYGPYPGKTDGLRIDPSTGALWLLNNEDANPVLRIVDLTTKATTTYALPTPTKYSGGYDDIAFTDQGTFLSASNPALTKNGTNTYRSLVRISIDGAGNPVIDPVLPGQVVATDRSTGAQVKVNITDPDSLSIVPQGDIVLDDQGDSTLLFIPARSGGSVSALFLEPAPTTNCGNPPAPPAVPCPPIVDETSWAPTSLGPHHALVADHAKPGAVYTVSGPFSAAGSAYTTVSGDNPTLAKTLGQLNVTTGVITPIVTGFSGPKGLLFVS